MAYLQISAAPDRASYEKVRALLPEAAPQGLITHAAAELPDGSVQIVDVYDSREDMERFVTSTLFPAFQAAGVMNEVMSRPAPSPLETLFLQRA